MKAKEDIINMTKHLITIIISIEIKNKLLFF